MDGGKWRVKKKPIGFVLQASCLQMCKLEACTTSEPQIRDPLAPECPRMSHNVPECPTMSHPNGPNGTFAPSGNDLSDNDLQDFNVPKCPKMSQNVPLSEKTGSAPVGSRFRVQSSRLGISDGTRRNVTVHVTKPDGSRRNPTPSRSGPDETRRNPTLAGDETRRNPTEPDTLRKRRQGARLVMRRSRGLPLADPKPWKGERK